MTKWYYMTIFHKIPFQSHRVQLGDIKVAYHSKQNVTCWRLETGQDLVKCAKHSGIMGVPKRQTQYTVDFDGSSHITNKKWHPGPRKFADIVAKQVKNAMDARATQWREGSKDVAVWQSWLGIRPQLQPLWICLIKDQYQLQLMAEIRHHVCIKLCKCRDYCSDLTNWQTRFLGFLNQWIKIRLALPGTWRWCFGLCPWGAWNHVQHPGGARSISWENSIYNSLTLLLGASLALKRFRQQWNTVSLEIQRLLILLTVHNSSTLRSKLVAAWGMFGLHWTTWVSHWHGTPEEDTDTIVEKRMSSWKLLHSTCRLYKSMYCLQTAGFSVDLTW